MASQRQIASYENRLAKIDRGTGITAECIGAVLTAYPDPGSDDTIAGTLIGFTHKRAMGLFGARIQTDVTICTACAHQRGDCSEKTEVTLTDVLLHSVARNVDPKVGA